MARRAIPTSKPRIDCNGIRACHGHGSGLFSPVFVRNSRHRTGRTAVPVTIFASTQPKSPTSNISDASGFPAQKAAARPPNPSATELKIFSGPLSFDKVLMQFRTVQIASLLFRLFDGLLSVMMESFPSLGRQTSRFCSHPTK